MSNRVILVIDDDAADRKQFRRWIKELPYGCEVIELADPTAADQIDEKVEVDFVLLDHLLPGSQGLDHIEALSRRWPRAAICLTTGQGDETIAKSAILKGAVDYVPKRNLSSGVLARIIENGCKLAEMRWKINEHRQDMEVFTEVLVHDLKAPIRSILFLIEKLGEDFDDGLQTEVRKDIRLIGRTAERMSELVVSLASHVQLERESEPMTFAAAELVENALALLVASIERAEVEIAVDVPPDLSLLCYGPEVVQLLQNLINNAIKYSGGRRPEITVTALALPGQEVQFSVADNGIGVDPEYAERIFEPFKRLPVAASIPGTGLGLATCRKIAQRHNGEIWCVPNHPRGTIFHTRLGLRGAQLARSA